MKNILLIAASLLIVLQSCDKIDSPYSENAGGGGIIDTTSGNLGIDSLNTDTLQRILLEEYTGHTCINCPAAHAEVQSLHGVYGEQLVTVAIHAGYYAQTQTNPNGSYSYDFRTPVGNYIFNEFLTASQPFPTGIVHRKKNTSGVYQTSYANWGTNIAPLVNVKPDAKLYLNNTFAAASRTITTKVNTGFFKDVNATLALLVLYTEDSIVNWQKNGTVNVEFYLHRHALRGSLNGNAGSVLGSSFIKNHGITNTYTSTPIQADIVPEHVSVVAILYNTVTKEVVQVGEKKLLE